MSDTPRTDGQCEHPDNISLWLSTGKHAPQPTSVVPADFARQLERELSEALKWKNEDPRMLREQIRVAVSAYSQLHQENKELRSQLEAMRKTRDDILSAPENQDPPI